MAADNVTIPKSAIFTAIGLCIAFGGFILRGQHANSTRLAEQAVEIRGIGKQLEDLAAAGPRYTREMAEKDNRLAAQELDAKFEKTLREAMLPMSIGMNQMEGKMGMVVELLDKMHHRDNQG